MSKKTSLTWMDRPRDLVRSAPLLAVHTTSGAPPPRDMKSGSITAGRRGQAALLTCSHLGDLNFGARDALFVIKDPSSELRYVIAAVTGGVRALAIDSCAL